MSKKPIKRNESIVRLSKDHHFGLLFCWKIRQGLKGGIAASRIIDYVRYFAPGLLLPHFKEEEVVLFALLDDGLVTKAIKQHKEIKMQLAKLSGNSEEILKKQLAELANMVDNHIRFEERELFPHLEIRLSKEQLAEAGKQLNDLHALPMKDDYEDEFWIKR
ncbi:MAG: hemerythrin domain-containing protein [Ginsengibacter sp.]